VIIITAWAAAVHSEWFNQQPVTLLYGTSSLTVLYCCCLVAVGIIPVVESTHHWSSAQVTTREWCD